MALIINDECVNCGACEPECPNEAISEGDEYFVINPDLCTECVGAFDESQCASVCPTEACVPDPDHKEDCDLFRKNTTRYTAFNHTLPFPCAQTK